MSVHTHQSAPTQYVEANGIRFAYRRFGRAEGVPIVFNQHYVGTMDYWDPAVTDPEQLLANCDAQVERMDNNGQPDIDFKPVVELFTPDAQCTWLLTELGRDDIAFGLCDLGVRFPELGFVSMAELRALRGPLGLPVERDEHFETDKPLSAYADEARDRGRIVT